MRTLDCRLKVIVLSNRTEVKEKALQPGAAVITPPEEEEEKEE